MNEDLSYAETVEILEDFVRLNLATVKRAKKQSDDIYQISEFGVWLGDNDKFLEYDNLPERRLELKRMFEEDKKRGWKSDQ